MNRRIIYAFISMMLLMLAFAATAQAEDINYAFNADSTIVNSRGTIISAYNNNSSPMAHDGSSNTYAMAADRLWGWRLDLGEIHKSIGCVAVTFADESKTPLSYQVLVSADNSNWKIVAGVTDNVLPERRMHKFLPSDVRYVKVQNTGSDTSLMGIAEIEVYRADEKDISAELIYPSSMYGEFVGGTALNDRCRGKSDTYG